MSLYTVCLINPPSAPGTTANREGAGGLGAVIPHGGGFFYPPQTLAYAAAALREQGYSVTAIDAVAEELDIEATLKRVEHISPEIVGVLVSVATAVEDERFLAALRMAWPRIRIVGFGTALRVMGKSFAADLADALLIGEPELMWPIVPDALSAADGFRHLTPGELRLENYDAEGFIQDLDRLPKPAWELLPLARYDFLTVSASRGCDDRCFYCPYILGQGARYRFRDIEAVADEMRWLSHTFAPQRVIFRDPVFAYQADRTRALCRVLQKQIAVPAWECESRPDHFDPELLREMKAAGCQTVKVGLESADPDLLIQLGRVPDLLSAEVYLNKTKQVVQACREIGLNCRLFVMVGLPGQNKESVNITAAYLKAVQPTMWQVKIYQPYPGLRWPSDTAVAEADTIARWQSSLEQALVPAAGPRMRTSVIGFLRRTRRWLHSLGQYHAGEQIRRGWFERVVLPHLAKLDSAQVLDAGSGNGLHAFLAARRAPKAQITGLDISATAVQDCQQRAAELNNLRFLIGDLTKPLGIECFDYIYSVDVMEHISDDQTVFNNLATALRPGGWLSIHTPLQPQRHTFRRFDHYHSCGHVREGYNEANLVARLEAAGLEMVSRVYTHGLWGTLAWELWQLSRRYLVPRLLLRPLIALLIWVELHSDNAWGNCIFVTARRPTLTERSGQCVH